MDFRIVEGRQMQPELIEAWRVLQDSNPKLASPYFCPEFTLAVAEARDDVRIAVIEDAGSISGFFPFQTDKRGFGRPVGAGVSDQEGIVCSADFRCDATELMRACGLIALDFAHLVSGQHSFSPYCGEPRTAAVIDLSHGFAAYAAQRKGVIAEARRDIRRLERKAGEARFVMHTGDEAIFERLVSWKCARYGDACARFFKTPWVRRTLNRVRAMETPRFAGVLSVLYAGDVPVAVSLCLRSRTVFHACETAYALEYTDCSPGLILLYKTLEAASNDGIHTFDLGSRNVGYKQRIKNSDRLFAAASVETGRLLRVSRKFGRSIRTMVEGSAIERPARQLMSCLRGMKPWSDAQVR
jgi:CelD/BcsL family acetyltransferase involved in cellulose biosynthesis